MQYILRIHYILIFFLRTFCGPGSELVSTAKKLNIWVFVFLIWILSSMEKQTGIETKLLFVWSAGGAHH